MTKRFPLFVLILILLLGAFCRFWGIDADLPDIYHPDEPIYVDISQSMFKDLDPNPHFFKYPSLFFYLNAVSYAPYFLGGKIAGVFATPADIGGVDNLTMGVTRALTPSAVLMQRSLTVVFGVAAILMVFMIGVQVYRSVWMALVPALFLALFRTNLGLDKVIAPDTYLLFFLLLTTWLTLRLYETPDRKHYILAGVCAGLSISVKYNGGLIFLPILVAHVMLQKRRSLQDGNIYWAALFAGLGFVFTTPFALFDFNTFIHDFYFEMMHYSRVGHSGMEGGSLAYYSSYLTRYVGLVMVILAGVEMIRGLWTRSGRVILVSVFPVIYFIMVSRMLVRNERTIFLIVPFVFILASGAVYRLVRQAVGRPLWTRIAVVAAALVLLGIPFARTVEVAMYVLSNQYYVDNRQRAQEWFHRNVEPGVTVALESYAPYLSPEVYDVVAVKRMIDHDTEWYRQQGVEYLVFSQAMYLRYFRSPGRHPEEVTRYNDFFETLPEVVIFDDMGRTIRVFRMAVEP